MKQRDIAIILVPALLLTIFWVLFNVYHNYVSSTITDPLTYLIIPIEGHFDQKAIDEIKTRKRVSPANEILIDVSTTPTPTPLLEESSATESANPNSSNQGTGR